MCGWGFSQTCRSILPKARLRDDTRGVGAQQLAREELGVAFLMALLWLQGITGVPVVMPDDQPGGMAWQQAEKYWE